ncbi:hypothetical protein PsorP6_004905 [Peronosclerospora sorghi]|uniref:Uncharacterized protein n=1 Tax=Peronosclerospora sorghi TaxID=230839 RepID=A0ACC0W5S0_9STRA|nr:hypothetical protein PsorP6_004905 [Peronosclerospora sorghi]
MLKTHKIKMGFKAHVPVKQLPLFPNVPGTYLSLSIRMRTRVYCNMEANLENFLKVMRNGSICDKEIEAYRSN